MRAAVAAGHPATVDVGIEVLADGGTAADAAVAAGLASCVAETVMTGLLGGGHAIYYDATSGKARNLDCFVAVPGLGAEPRRRAELVELEVPFGTELVHYAVGIASCGVPGLPAGLGALHAEHGRLPWARLVEPALRLARDGVEFPAAHAACLAMLEPVMTMNEGAGIYSPGGALLQAGGRLRQPGLGRALELVADEGAQSAYEGSLGAALLELMDERGGLVTRNDLAAYQAIWSEPVEVAYAGTRVLTRAGLAPLADCLEALPALRGRAPGERAVALAHALDRPDQAGDTTSLVTVDAEGNACVLTSSLGLGAGEWLPGLDLHLNSMLGEADLIREPLRPGERMGSMMSPTLASRRRRAGAGRRRRGRHATAQRTRPGAGGDARRRAFGRRCRRAASAASGGGRRPPRARLAGRGAARARSSRLRRARVAGPTPLLRRCQRRHADGRGG